MKRIFLFLLLTLTLPHILLAQQTWNLKRYSVQLPRVSTVQQITSTIVEPQPGSVVYNTDQQKLALRNNTGWQYLDASDGTYQNIAFFTTTSVTSSSGTIPANPNQTWTIPIGVTRFEVELWGGGAGGGNFGVSGANADSYTCSSGGYAGGYARKTITVNPSINTVSVGPGVAGGGGNGGGFASRYSGGDSFLTYNGQTLRAGGGLLSGPGSGSDGISGQPALVVKGGSPGPFSVTYGQRSSTDFIRTIQCSGGGVAYGTPPQQAGIGVTVAFRNAETTAYYRMNGDQSDEEGSFPGGGGGCGYETVINIINLGPTPYRTSGNGSPGLIIIRW